MRASPIALLAVAACAAVVVWLRSGRPEVRGVLVDATGVPVPGARVGYEGETAGVRTDSRGAFAIEARELGGRLVVLDAGYATVRPSAAAPGDTSRAHVVVAAPAVEMHGRMVDACGEGIAGTLHLDLGGSGEYAQPFGGEALAGPVAWAVAAPDGRFAARWPYLPRARVVADVPMIETRVLGPLGEFAPPLDVVMGRRGGLFGSVRRADGTASAGATVALGRYSTSTDESGLFAMDRVASEDFPKNAALVVTADGHEPVVHRNFGSTVDLEDPPCAGFELVLGNPVPTVPEPATVVACELAVRLDRASPHRRYEVRLAHRLDLMWGPIDVMPDTWAADRVGEGPAPTRTIRGGRRVFLGYRAGRFLGPPGEWDVVLFDVWDRREVGREHVVLTPERRTTVSF